MSVTPMLMTQLLADEHRKDLNAAAEARRLRARSAARRHGEHTAAPTAATAGADRRGHGLLGLLRRASAA